MTTPTENLLAKLPEARRSGDGWAARCPAHEDRNASLSINDGDDGRALVHCFAGCPNEEIVAALGLTMADLMPNDGRASHNGHASNGKQPGDKRKYATATDAIAALTSKRGAPSATWQYDDATGAHIGTVCRWDTADGKAILPVSRNGSSGWHCAGMAEPRPLYQLTTLATAETVFVTEGEKAADAAHSIGLTATTSAHGAKSPAKTDWTPLAGKSVVILPDNDSPGREYAETVAGILAKLEPPASVKIVELPGLPDSGDICEWIDDLHGEAAEPDSMREEIEALVSAAGAWQPKAKPKRGRTRKPTAAKLPQRYDAAGRIEIELTTAEDAINEQTAVAVAGHPDLYLRGGLPVCIGIDDGQPSIRLVVEPIMRHYIAGRVQYFTAVMTDSGPAKTPEHPPSHAVKAMANWPNWPLEMRELRGILECPTIRPDGTILDTPGYDPATKLLYLPGDCRPTIPATPTRSDAIAARDALLDVVADFPFLNPDAKPSAHRSGWFAWLLTMACRYVFDGPAPLFALDAATAGTGKGLLADTAFIIATGNVAERFPCPEDDAEARKKITTLAMAATWAVLIDNVGQVFGLPSIDAALTATTWTDRIITTMRQFSGPLKIVWSLTANNFQVRGDTSRRICHIRMVAPCERPEERTGFRYPNLLAHVREHRAELLGAALIVARAWFVAGRPRKQLPPWGSFEGWSDTIRQIVVWLDLPDPAETRKEFRARADREADSLIDLLSGIETIDQGDGLLASEIVERCEAKDVGTAELRRALVELCGTKAGKLDTRAVGRKLASLRERIIDGRWLDYHERGGRQRGWFVRRQEEQSDKGD